MIKLETLKTGRPNPRIIAAIALIFISLLAAIGISQSANKSILIWAAKNRLVTGAKISIADIKSVRVFLPENSKLYLSNKATVVGATITRNIGPDELIPVSAVTNETLPNTRKSVPIKVLRNDFPADLVAGSLIDIYALPIRDTSAKSEASAIAHAALIESIDSHNRDIGGEVGIVIKLKDDLINDFLSATINSRLVVVRSAF